MANIVVGIDGSEGSRRALAWAVDEAHLRGAVIVAVHAWSYPYAVGTYEAVMPELPGIDFEAEARETLSREVKEVTGGGDGVEIRQLVVRQPAAVALIEASRDAEMLVIGSRGLGGFRGLLLGSVGHQCVQHAACPVVVIPHEERSEG